MNTLRHRAAAAAIAALLVGTTSFSGTTPDGTSLTYQGRLFESGAPMTGQVDARFRVFDQPVGGTLVAGPVTRTGIDVNGGIFATDVDFGPIFVGAERWLQIDVRSSPGGGAYESLSPRQLITPAPTSQFAMVAGSMAWNDISGIPAGFADGTDDEGPWDFSGFSAVANRNVGIFADPPQTLLHIGNSPVGSPLLTPPSDLLIRTQTAVVELVSSDVTTRPGSTISFKGADASGDLIDHWALFRYDTSLYFSYGPGVGPDFNPVMMALSSAGHLGVGTFDPVSILHLANDNVTFDSPAVLTEHTDLLVVSQDALLELVSTGQGSVGSTLSLKEVDGAGSLHNHWAIFRRTDVDGARLDLSFGQDRAASNNPRILSILADGRIGMGTTNPFAKVDVRRFDPSSTTISGRSDGTGAGVGVLGSASTGYGVYGEATGNSGVNYGVFGEASGSASYAVFAAGRLAASGTKSFVIDHPTRPEEEFLFHYSTESPQPQNAYNGVVTLNQAGRATVELPDYFAAINTDFRYQLTAIGEPALLYIAEEILNNQFVIAGGTPGMKVSWEVKAQRSDLYVQRMGAPESLRKSPELQGRYLMPGLYDQPADKGIRPHQAISEEVTR